MKILLLLLPLILLGDACRIATISKSRTHPVTQDEIKKEIENNLLIIKSCHKYPEVTAEAKLYNEYLLFKYLKLPTVHLNDNELIERCRSVNHSI